MSSNIRGYRSDKKGSEDNLRKRVRQYQDPDATAGWEGIIKGRKPGELDGEKGEAKNR